MITVKDFNVCKANVQSQIETKLVNLWNICTDILDASPKCEIKISLGSITRLTANNSKSDRLRYCVLDATFADQMHLRSAKDSDEFGSHEAKVSTNKEERLLKQFLEIEEWPTIAEIDAAIEYAQALLTTTLHDKIAVLNSKL